MNNTTNYNLNLPESDDYYDVDDYNSNFDTIDTQLKTQADHTSSGINNISGVHGLRVNNNVLEAYVNGSWNALSVNNARNNYIVTSDNSSGTSNVNNVANNSVRLNLHDGTNVLSSKLVKGSNNTTVTTDSDSNIIIDTVVPTYSLGATVNTDSNENYDFVNLVLNKSDGTSSGKKIQFNVYNLRPSDTIIQAYDGLTDGTINVELYSDALSQNSFDFYELKITSIQANSYRDIELLFSTIYGNEVMAFASCCVDTINNSSLNPSDFVCNVIYNYIDNDFCKIGIRVENRSSSNFSSTSNPIIVNVALFHKRYFEISPKTY